MKNLLNREQLLNTEIYKPMTDYIAKEVLKLNKSNQK